MDALLASAGPLKPKKGPRGPQPNQSRAGPSSHKTVQRGPNEAPIDPSLHSILPSTRIPTQYHRSNLAKGSGEAPIRPDAKISRIGDKKLRAKVARQDVSGKRAEQERNDVNMWLNAPLAGSSGGIEVDEEMGERSWRVKQDEIVKEVAVSSGKKRFDLKMENLGSYKVNYTRNGRHLAIASSSGHVATFDWQAGKLHSETYLKESVRDITFLHSEQYFAVAQKRYVYIYDQNGVELHKMKQHIDPTHLEFLPYHFLLTSVGHAGVLKYHDTTTGSMLTQIPTHLGSPSSMTQNPHSAIIHLGHSNGTMTLWSPNINTPHIKLLAHRGPILGIAVDGSEGSIGRYTATAGMDGMIKIWDGRMWGKELHSWHMRNTITSVAYSGKGLLAVGGKSGVSIFKDTHSEIGEFKTSPYLTLPLPSLTASGISWCPFEDILCVGHDKGISSLLVPGAGEANFDSGEADVFETATRRREREVRNVMDKIRPELITMDTEHLGKVAEKGPRDVTLDTRSFRQLNRMERLKLKGEYNPENDGDNAEQQDGGEEEDDDEEDGKRPGKKVKDKHKMRGKNTGLKKHLRKKAKVDPSIVQMRAKIALQKQAAAERKAQTSSQRAKVESGALARFG